MLGLREVKYLTHRTEFTKGINSAHIHTRALQGRVTLIMMVIADSHVRCMYMYV